MVYNYKTKNTCSTSIRVELDGNIVKDIEFTGGCNGNLKAVAQLVKGKTVDEIEKELTGITCGRRPTSCADQLAKAVRAAYNSQEKE